MAPMRRTLIAAVLAGIALGACGGGDGDGGPAEPLRLASPDVRDGGELPRRLTCDGEGAEPALEWSEVPGEATSIAVLVEDLDAPGGPAVHWSVWGLAPQARSLVGEGPIEGDASSGDAGWVAPCPPRGDRPHRYRIALHALRDPLPLEGGAAPDAVRRAVRERSLASAELVATYAR
jgi:Raf kinase inhibitor-like YbhB/YbcL family protein